MTDPRPSQHDTQNNNVQEAVRDLIALRKLSAATGTITTRTQNDLIRRLKPEVLVRVARILAEVEEASQ
jgi:hypothetical protein